jgi:organic radical activating enzyme
MSELPKSLILLFTFRCPLECKHCIVDSNPRRSEGLKTNLVLQLIDEAATLGIQTIGFTGGDPFVRQADLRRFVARVAEHGMQAVIVTSAFWANSLEQALRTLEPFSSIYMLGISTDTHHREYTSINKIRNVIRAAKRVEINRIELQITYLDSADIDAVINILGDDASGIIIRKQKLWPVGQAASLILGHEDALIPVDDLDLQCPMGAPVITPDGKMKGCCSSLLNLNDANPIILGDVLHDGLANVIAQTLVHPYYVFLKTFGLGPIVEMVKRGPKSALMKRAYTDVCHLCHDVHANQGLQEYLVKQVSNAYASKK